MTSFLQNGDVFSPTPGKDAMLPTLPVGNYIVIETMQGLMFKRVDSFTKPGRMYGRINDRAERILNTFLDRPRTTGVLLSGEKGSGKSQLARNIAYDGYELGLPTILVNAPYCGDAFNALLASIDQPAIILMDEFEKVYSDQERQEQVLTLLDGMMTSKKLFVLTVNDKYRVNEHMKNRPGRIFYAIEFDGLEQEFVKEYCDDNLDNKDEIGGVLKIAALFKAFNFDMLKALVEEMNRYKESAFEAVEMLNAKPFSLNESVKYEVFATTPKGIKSNVTEVGELPMAVHHNAIGVLFEFGRPSKKSELDKLFKELGLDAEDYDEDEQNYSMHFAVRSKDLKKIDAENGHYEFVISEGNQKGYVVSFTKKKPVTHSLHDFAY